MRRSVVAIVGRPNVGKSSLFNRLLGRRVAIVEPMPGLTRDRLYGTVTWGDREIELVDTGGLISTTDDPILTQVVRQAERAIEDADVVLFVVDAHSGLLPEDREVAQRLREAHRPILLVVNKVDELRHADTTEFYELGLGEPLTVSALHGLNVPELTDAIGALLPAAEPMGVSSPATHVAIVGRPNVGKSSLLNAIVGEDRVVVDPAPGTTRDAVDTPLRRGDQHLVLIDTAGLRRKARIDEAVERYSAARSLRAIDRADVVALVLDATVPVAEQDQEIARYTQEQGRALLLVVNKVDQVSPMPRLPPAALASIRAAMRFVAYAPIVLASARRGWGIASLLDQVSRAVDAFGRRIGTGPLNRVVADAEQAHPPAADRAGRQLKIYYATQAQAKPPTVVFFVNDPTLLTEPYRRFLERRLRGAFDLQGTPIRLFARPRGRPRTGR